MTHVILCLTPWLHFHLLALAFLWLLPVYRSAESSPANVHKQYREQFQGIYTYCSVSIQPNTTCYPRNHQAEVMTINCLYYLYGVAEALPLTR